jgi:Ni/Co efflux regulator RcnB
MLRLLLIVAAVAIVALPSLDARAQGKDKGKTKACAASSGNSALPRDRCPEQKAGNAPTQLQIGRSSFGSGGSTFKGGAPGTSLRPVPTGPAGGSVHVPVGGSARMK